MQTLTQETVAPPTIRNAGRLHTTGDAEGGLEVVLVSVALLVLAAGGMLLALMVSQGRARRGLVFHVAYGAVAAAVMFIVAPYMSDWAVAFAGLWLALTLLGLAIGSLFRLPARK